MVCNAVALIQCECVLPMKNDIDLHKVRQISKPGPMVELFDRNSSVFGLLLCPLQFICVPAAVTLVDSDIVLAIVSGYRMNVET